MSKTNSEFTGTFNFLLNATNVEEVKSWLKQMDEAEIGQNESTSSQLTISDEIGPS